MGNAGPPIFTSEIEEEEEEAVTWEECQVRKPKEESPLKSGRVDSINVPEMSSKMKTKGDHWEGTWRSLVTLKSTVWGEGWKQVPGRVAS